MNINNEYNKLKIFTAVTLLISSGHPIKLDKTVLINEILAVSETVKFVIKEDKISLNELLM